MPTPNLGQYTANPNNETITVTMSGNVVVSMLNSLSLGVPALNFNFPLSLNMAAGTGDGRINVFYFDQRSLGGQTAEEFNVFNFNGTLDPLGSPVALARVKFMILQNLATDDTQKPLNIGSGAGPNSWTSYFGNSGTIALNGTSFFMAYDPGPQGYPVGSTNNNLLKIYNSGTTTVQYNIVVIGVSS